MANALLAGLLAACTPVADDGPVVLAASSMQDAMEDAADRWAASGHERPVLSFASSASVARQVGEGAPADLVITSDSQWMDWLAGQGALDGNPRPLVANALVVVAPASARTPPSLSAFAADPDGGRLAIAEPESVPAGQFARQALESLDLWKLVRSRIVPAENVRAALALVERGEVPLGIVYATDANASRKVRIVQRLAPATHDAIVYYVARTGVSDHAEAPALLEFLLGARGQAAFAAQGFTPAPAAER
ncbi:molybdate ABC transporter substrate-binding protein [Aurantiacibacter spongiae]|uniref:Molybdate ABC transporter substrate-binding protein n=2 Tax=Aurantiacibacter spongiae TaxID=2488860 RepID=A0A3N5CRW9_9SPHN|nr:molybdate ABC transporter substrate-binding protein [Aurantiacibacter spongiae]